MKDKTQIPEKPKSLKAKLPHQPAEYTKKDAEAIQAILTGTANEHQQKRALRWIIESVCKPYESSFYPGNDELGHFAEGKRYCGNQIIKLTKLNLSLIKE